MRPRPQAQQRHRRSTPRQCSAAALLCLAVFGCAEQESPAPASGRPIVLIVVDTLRADHLGSYGYPRPTSPAFDRWARGGALFERALATSSWTLPSFASIYTGLYPRQHGAGDRLDQEEWGVTGLDPELPVLAEILSEAGYVTGALANNPFLHEKFGVARGFADYRWHLGTNEVIRRADKTVDLALEWVDARAGAPFFLLVHFFDPHMDYDPPVGHRGRFTGSYRGKLPFPVTDAAKIKLGWIPLDDADRAYVTGSYDEEVAFTDEQLGRLLQGLEERGLMGEALVILTSDHGEELFERGSFEHGHSKYQELLHVPLVIWGEDVKPGRIDTPVSIVDLFPSVLEAAGLPVPEGGVGISLLPAATGRGRPPERPILADGTLHGRRKHALIRWPWKAVAVPAQEETLLFNLEEDPGEQRNLADRHPERLRAMLAEFEAISPPRSREGPAAEIDAGVREQLEALGYATPPAADGPVASPGGVPDPGSAPPSPDHSKR
ncbi:MAG: sulfatase [Deltaproteobacteria bacterium]|nr:sulfatase [Deltaproteobacteria bacterium]MBW2420903.1 sulfatase [Deltaproteobacteria bacterium]